MADSLIHITLATTDEPATVAERVLAASEVASARDGVHKLVRELDGLAARKASVAVRVDSATRVAASQTVAVTAASCVAGDKLRITVPGYGRVELTAVATNAEVTAAPNTGLYSLQTSTDTAVAQSMRDAINTHGLLRYQLTATESSGTVTIAAQVPGTWGNGILLQKAVTTAGALVLGAATLTAGADMLATPTCTVTFGTADIAANDTTSIGGRKYTWKASASLDGEITLSTTEATAAANFAAAVNADTTWTGLLTATVSTAVVTLTWLGDPRAGKHILVTIAVANSGAITSNGTAMITGAKSFTATTAVTASSTTRTYPQIFGAP